MTSKVNILPNGRTETKMDIVYFPTSKILSNSVAKKQDPGEKQYISVICETIMNKGLCCWSGWVTILIHK